MANSVSLPQEMDGCTGPADAPLNPQNPQNPQDPPFSSLAGVPTHTRQSSSTACCSVRSRSQSQPSPPLTPRSAYEGMSSQPPVFHNYLRAFYHYTPNSIASSSSDDSSITVAIRQGDVILVHSVHPNGWADGTLLASRARGWLPTNYCEPYDHPTIRNLLNALTNLWDLVRDGENGNVVAFTKHDYVRSMIAGVRFFLEKTGCLSRDSRMIVAHVGLRRMRKGLLGDLSSLVKTAKKFQELLQVDNAQLPVVDHLNGLVQKSFKLATRAVRFLDIWATDAVPLSSDVDQVSIQRPLTPLSDAIDAVVQPLEASSNMVEADLSACGHESLPSKRPLSSSEESSTSIHEPKQQVRCACVHPSSPFHSDPRQTPVLFTSPQPQMNRLSITHRLSYTGKSSSTHQGDLASGRLNMAHDAFLGLIASFIGLHLQSRSTEELAEITEQSVTACQQLLLVVTEVWERDAQRSLLLKEARDNMHARLFDLVQATQDVFSLTEAEASEELIVDSGKRVVATATSCVRSAGECATKARTVIETVGDFEFEATGFGSSDTIFQQLPPLNSPNVDKEEVAWPLESCHNDQSSFVTAPAIKPLTPLPLVLPESQPWARDSHSILLEHKKSSSQFLQTSVLSESPVALSFTSSTSSLPIQSVDTSVLTPPSSVESLASPVACAEDDVHSHGRGLGTSMYVTEAGPPVHNFSMPGGPGSTMSHPSTRATTPDHSHNRKCGSQTLTSSFSSFTELRSLASDDMCLGEEHLLETSYMHELLYNKEGQISGGSLPALVEQLTTYESTPDAVFVTAFYLTFRLFTTPVELAQCLIDRFDYIGNSQAVGIPVRLRVYNVFKGWLESHWSGESDLDALSIIRDFAHGRLAVAMPTAGKRLVELAFKVTEARAGALVPRLVSSIGKTGISNVAFTPTDSNVPSPIITKSQLNALRACKEGRSSCSILDFDPLELARQFTIIESKLFCAIQPEELLALEWTKKSDSKAHHVKAMSTLSTDLANLVADTILHLEDAKKRAAIIKQWVKIAMKCLELNNYDSLMAIICSLNSSMVTRLKRTWELVSAKTKTRLDELKAITDVGRNYSVLRQRLHNHVAPCLPFVGIYLTDLTFIDVGNGTTRQLPGESGSHSVSVINFDKHMKTAKIIGQLQSFQVPYRLSVIPELQDWMEMQIQRVRSSDQANVQSYYRRSLLLEPREAQQVNKRSPSIDHGNFSAESRNTSRDKLFLHFNFSTSSMKS